MNSTEKKSEEERDGVQKRDCSRKKRHGQEVSVQAGETEVGRNPCDKQSSQERVRKGTGIWAPGHEIEWPWSIKQGRKGTSVQKRERGKRENE